MRVYNIVGVIIIQLTSEEAIILHTEEIEECTDFGTELKTKLFEAIKEREQYDKESLGRN